VTIMKNTTPEPGTTTDAARDTASLLEDLGATDVMTRLRARHALVARGEEVLPVLLKALSDESFVLRWESAKALGELRSPRAAPNLVVALEDDEQDVRWLAATALAAIGHPALRPLLEAVLERPESPYLRQGAHHVLTVFHDEALREPLLQVRAALGLIKDQASLIPAIEKALDALDQPAEGEAP
jgi:HEAT repeat protein